MRQKWRIYGNFDTNSWSKNKVLTHFLATLTQFLARLRCETGIRGSNFGMVGVRLFQAGLWVNLEFGQSYASEKRRTNILIKLKDLAILCVKSGGFMVFLTACYQHFRLQQIEPPTPDRVTRIVRSAYRTFETTLYQTISGRLDERARAALLALLGEPQADQRKGRKVNQSHSSTCVWTQAGWVWKPC